MMKWPLVLITPILRCSQSILYKVACPDVCGEDVQDKESCRPGGSVMTRLSVGLNEQTSAELQHSCVRLYKINGIFLRKQPPA